MELRAVPYGRTFSLLTLEAGWTPASSGQKSPSCFSSVHGACVSYLSRVYWFRLNVVLGRPSGPRSGANSQPAPSERGQDKRVCVCTSPCELTWVNSNDLFRGKKNASKLSTNGMKEVMTLCSARERKNGAQGEAVAPTPSFGHRHSKVRMWIFVPISELHPHGIFNQKSV